MFGWKWPSGTGEEAILILSLYLLQLSPLGIGHGPSFEETWIPFTQGSFGPNWLKLAQWFWRFFFKFRHCIFVISLLSPLGKGHEPSKPLHPCNTLALSQVWSRLVHYFWRRSVVFNFANVFLLFRYYLTYKTAHMSYLYGHCTFLGNSCSSNCIHGSVLRVLSIFERYKDTEI